MKRVVAIIVAGGGGKRMGGDLPKQFLPLGGRPLLDRTLSAFTSSARVDGVILALPPAFPDGAKESYRSVPKVLAVVDGGSQRQDSVRNSLAVVPAEAEVILVHDAVRPFVSEGLLGRCVELAREHGAVVPVVPVRSTVKQWDREGKTLCTRDRSDLMLAQTPQGFRAGILRDAYRRAEEEGRQGTDDASLVEGAGYPVIPGPGGGDAKSGSRAGPSGWGESGSSTSEACSATPTATFSSTRSRTRSTAPSGIRTSAVIFPRAQRKRRGSPAAASSPTRAPGWWRGGSGWWVSTPSSSARSRRSLRSYRPSAPPSRGCFPFPRKG